MTLGSDWRTGFTDPDLDPIRSLRPGTRGGRRYRFFQSRSGSYWVLPAGPAGRTAAAWLHSPQTPAGRMLKRVMTSRLPMGKPVTLDGDAVADLSHLVAGLLGLPGADLGFTVGPPRPANRLTAAIIGAEGRPAAFAKIGSNAAGSDRLAHEADTVDRLARFPAMEGRVPKLIGRFTWGGHLGILLSPGPREPAPKLAGPRHGSFLEILRNATGGSLRFEETATGRELSGAAESVSDLTSAERIRFGAVWERLVGVFGPSSIPTMLSHGDFVPWNMRIARDGLWVFDWEMARDADLVLTDALHFEFMPLALMGRAGAGRAWVPEVARRLWPDGVEVLDGLRLAFSAGLAWRYARPRNEAERAANPVLTHAYRRIDELLGHGAW